MPCYIQGNKLLQNKTGDQIMSSTIRVMMMTEIKTDNIAEIPKVEREITFINERIKSFPAVYPLAHITSSFSTAT